MKIANLIVAGLILSACSNNEITSKNIKSSDTSAPEEQERQRPIAYDLGKFVDSIDGRYLYGGENPEDNFDVTNSSLIEKQFHYGIGREVFPALLNPAFTSISKLDTIWADTSRFLVALGETEIKAYSISDLTRHEVVNDRLDGEPIMAAYCILADLGAIYSRQYREIELTFALSGYTYYDAEVWNGLDGFILWDRDTESLWWPLIGKAVSGPLKDVEFKELEETKWVDTDWKAIKKQYPNAKILVSNQDFERPKSWPRLTDVDQIVNPK